MSLAELVVASLVFIIVTAVAAPLLVRIVQTQSTLGRVDAQITSVNDATEQVLALGCASTLTAAGTAATRTTIMTRATNCGSLLTTLTGVASTVTPWITGESSSGDVRAAAGATRFELRSSWINPALGRRAWLPDGTDGTAAANVLAAAPTTPELLLQRTVTVTTPIDGRPTTRQATHLAGRPETEIPAGPVGRLEVVVPPGYDKVAIQFRTDGPGGPTTETLWLVRHTLNFDDYSAGATLAGGSNRRIASFPYLQAGGAYTVKAIRTSDSDVRGPVSCTVTAAGDPRTRGDLNVCYLLA